MNSVQIPIIVPESRIRHARHFSTVDVDQHEQTPDMKQPRFSLSQETITILTVGVALAGLILVMIRDSRAERARLDASIVEMRAEGRAYREAFDRKITRLIEQQGTLNGVVDGLRNPIQSSEE